MNKIPLVSSNIYEFFIDTSLVDESLDYFLSQKLTSKKALPQDDSAWHIHFEKPNNKFVPVYYDKLFDEIQKCVDKVCDIHFTNNKLAICDSWLTKTMFGKTSTLHMHTNSLFSGLLYFSESKTKTRFVVEDPFFKRNKHLFSYNIKPIMYEHTVEPKKGKLIIWESYIDHQISLHKEKEVRYTLAFNTWLTGTICDNTTGELYANLVDVKQRNQ